MDDFYTLMVDYCRPGHIQHCGMEKTMVWKYICGWE